MSETKIGQRTMRPMKEAITRQIPNMATEPGVLIEYQPGNMTRYEVYIQKLSATLSEPMGLGYGATLIVFCNLPNRPSLMLGKQCSYLSVDYVMEKTGLNLGDAEPLIALISHHLGLNLRTS